MNATITLENCSKRYHEQVALHEVSLSVPPGAVFALLGENGAGKTTAIRILLGTETCDSGHSSVLGFDSRRDGLAIRRRVGYVPERPILYEWMTVDEIGWFAAGFYPEGYRQRYRRLIDQFALPPGKKLATLSKGNYAKVGLALAMAHDPELMILDEPTSGLDPLVRRAFLESMVDRAAAGKTVLLASHQIAEVERVADYVAILHQGRLMMVERLETLHEQVRTVSVTMVAESSLPPELDGQQLLGAERQGRQWRLLVRGQEGAGVERLRNQPQVGAVEERRATLEEIFVAIVQGRKPQQQAAVLEEVL